MGCEFIIWESSETLQRIDGIQPRLESWNLKDDPDQIRLQSYLNELEADLNLGQHSHPLHLHLDIARPASANLLHHHDLENYLTPVVRRLGHQRFVRASARKFTGDVSSIWITKAIEAKMPKNDDYCHAFICNAGAGATEKAWKEGIRNKLADTSPDCLDGGPVSVRLAWRCAPHRNWVNLWKPTVDAMGPVLGEPHPGNPFNPNDDRIVELDTHLSLDESFGHDVVVGMWWRTI
jgi:hypothetical protein